MPHDKLGGLERGIAQRVRAAQPVQRIGAVLGPVAAPQRSPLLGRVAHEQLLGHGPRQRRRRTGQATLRITPTVDAAYAQGQRRILDGAAPLQRDTDDVMVECQRDNAVARLMMGRRHAVEGIGDRGHIEKTYRIRTPPVPRR
jgi:hypothetical protein